jgi:hypothetical protein
MSFVLLASFKQVCAPQICCASYLNWLERSCHLWTSTFFLKSAPYPLMYAYFPPFVCFHCIHDLCISHSLSSKLQIPLLHKRSPSLRKHCAYFPRYANPVLYHSLRKACCSIFVAHPLNHLCHCCVKNLF